MANEQSPVQSPVQQPTTQSQITQLEQRIKALEDRLQNVLSAKVIRAQRFEIMDNNEVRRMILTLSDDQKSVSLKLFNNLGSVIASVEERFDDGADLILTGGAANSPNVMLKATKDDAQAFFLRPSGDQWMLFDGHLKLFRPGIGRVMEMGTDEVGETDLKFFNGSQVVADIGMNGAGGGSVNVNSSSGFINIRSDTTGNQIQVNTGQKGSVIIRAIDDPSIKLLDKNGKEHVSIEVEENFAEIQLKSDDVGSGTLVSLSATENNGSLDFTVGNQGAGASLAADANGGEARLLHRSLDENGRRMIVLDAQDPTPSIRVTERRNSCSVRPTEILFLSKGKIVSQVPESVVDEEGVSGNSSDGNTLTMSLGERKMANDGPRLCPSQNPFKSHGFDTRDHFIEVLCEVTHPTIQQVKDDVIDCARKAAIVAGIVAVVVSVASDGSATSGAFASAVATFKVTFKQCLISKGVDIANELTPKISSRSRFGEWSGHG